MAWCTRLCVIRHGETTWNTERRIQGQIDVALNAEGQRQAAAAAEFLREVVAAALYASDLVRAWATAQALSARVGLKPQPAPALRERRYGDFEGLTYDEARVRHPEAFAAFETRRVEFALPGDGESLLQLQARVLRCVDELVAAHRGQTVFLVTHGGVLDILHRHASGKALAAPRDFQIPNAALNWFSVEGDAWRIDEWGSLAHLELARDEL